MEWMKLLVSDGAAVTAALYTTYKITNVMPSHLDSTFFTEICIAAFQQLSLHKLIKGILQCGILHCHIQREENLLLFIPRDNTSPDA